MTGSASPPTSEAHTGAGFRAGARPAFGVPAEGWATATARTDGGADASPVSSP